MARKTTTFTDDQGTVWPAAEWKMIACNIVVLVGKPTIHFILYAWPTGARLDASLKPISSSKMDIWIPDDRYDYYWNKINAVPGGKLEIVAFEAAVEQGKLPA